MDDGRWMSWRGFGGIGETIPRVDPSVAHRPSSIVPRPACRELAIALALSRGDDVVPVVGARRRQQLEEAIGALQLKLSPDDIARIEGVVPPGAAAGTRYDAHAMTQLDSERAT